jgi:hypothetical protein
MFDKETLTVFSGNSDCVRLTSLTETMEVRAGNSRAKVLDETCSIVGEAVIIFYLSRGYVQIDWYVLGHKILGYFEPWAMEENRHSSVEALESR